MSNRRNFLKSAGLIGGTLTFFPGIICGRTASKLQKVLIIGDSISGGYFPYAEELLKGKAILIKPKQLNAKGEPTSCEGTTLGVENIDKWLGDINWDVIHFNFGLHDIKHIKPGTNKNSKNPNDPHQAEPKQYGKNLKEIVKKMKATGAKLIFATTTPYPATAIKPLRLPGMTEEYNKVARKIMKKNEVVINDLYALALPRMDELQIPDNVHFTEAGYNVLGERVATEILKRI